MSEFDEDERGIGDNSRGVHDAQLEQLIQRVETINEEIKGAQDDRKDVFLEAKSLGYDLPTMRAVIKRRAMDRQKREEMDMLLDTYEQALG